MARPPTKKEEPAPPPKSGKKWLVALFGVVILTLAAGGGAVWALKKNQVTDDGDGDTPKQAAKKATKLEQVPQFVRLEPLTVKLAADQGGQEQYLQLLPELRALDLRAGEKIKAYLPQLRHDMLSLLSAKKASEISTAQGIDALSVELRARLNQSLGDSRTPSSTGAKAGPDEAVQSVLFSSFIVQ